MRCVGGSGDEMCGMHMCGDVYVCAFVGLVCVVCTPKD